MPKFVSLVFFSYVAWARLLNAQGETTSAISGQVHDPSGGVVVGAKVSVTNLSNVLKRSVQTDDAGRFTFPQLKPGSYSVQVMAAGFETQRIEGITAGLGQTQTVNFTLKLDAAKQDVTVTGEAPLIN